MVGTDALSRIEPVARDLLARVDAALVAHGAPPDHALWSLLRRLHTTPGDAVAFFAARDDEPLRAAGAAVRAEASGYEAARIPDRVDWQGAVGDLYAAQAAALRAHLGDATRPAADSLTGRLGDTASYVDEVADWWRESRGLMAAALAEVLTSAQAVTMGAGSTDDGLRAAADIGAHVLAAALRAHDAGHDLVGRWVGRLDEVPFRAPAITGPAEFEATIDVRH
jgi:hypothetical protein